MILVSERGDDMIRKNCSCLTKKHSKIWGKWIPMTKIKGQEVQHKMKLLLAVSIVSLQCHSTAADSLLLIQRLSTTTMLISIRIKTFQNHLSGPILWLSVTFGRIRCISAVHADSKTLQNRTLCFFFFFHLKNVLVFALKKRTKMTR